jgi:hypothetical protein
VFIAGFLGKVRQRRTTVTTRRFQAYCIGSAKSGTHSLAAIFACGYASRHEAEHSRMIRAAIARADGSRKESALRCYLIRRDRRLCLEMDSSQLNGVFADLLADSFPQARFVLTIRDCYSFLDSVINHQLARPASDSWKQFRELRFGGFEHSAHARILAERGLYPLDGYLAYWARHNTRALEQVPPERLLVIRTHEIRQSIPRLAEFLDIPAETIDASQSHAYPAAGRFGIVAQIDRGFLDDRIEAHCGPLMRRFFPEIMELKRPSPSAWITARPAPKSDVEHPHWKVALQTYDSHRPYA